MFGCKLMLKVNESLHMSIFLYFERPTHAIETKNDPILKFSIFLKLKIFFKIIQKVSFWLFSTFFEHAINLTTKSSYIVDTEQSNGILCKITFSLVSRKFFLIFRSAQLYGPHFYYT